MNRIYNNEAIIMLCIVKLLQGEFMDMAKLFLCVVLAVDDKLNLQTRNAYSVESLYAEIRNDQLLNRKYISYGPYFINAIIMLRQLNCVGINGDCIYLKKSIFCNEKKIPSRRMKRIYKASENIQRLFGGVSTNEIYNNLGIQL